ncbi:MAG: hypothetical protein ACYC8V_14500 [Caulobacteraceae bacterium]
MSGKTFLHFEYAFFIAILIAAFAFALWKGDRPARLGASFNLIAGLLATLFYKLLRPDVQPLAELAVDAGLAAGFLFLALRYASLWLGAALLLQAVQFSLHAYYLISQAPHDATYKLINNLDSIGIIAAILLSTVIAWRLRSNEVAAI